MTVIKWWLRTRSVPSTPRTPSHFTHSFGCSAFDILVEPAKVILFSQTI